MSSETRLRSLAPHTSAPRWSSEYLEGRTIEDFRPKPSARRARLTADERALLRMLRSLRKYADRRRGRPGTSPRPLDRCDTRARLAGRWWARTARTVSSSSRGSSRSLASSQTSSALSLTSAHVSSDLALTYGPALWARPRPPSPCPRCDLEFTDRSFRLGDPRGCPNPAPRNAVKVSQRPPRGKPPLGTKEVAWRPGNGSSWRSRGRVLCSCCSLRRDQAPARAPRGAVRIGVRSSRLGAGRRDAERRLAEVDREHERARDPTSDRSARERYVEDWRQAEARFVNDPRDAIGPPSEWSDASSRTVGIQSTRTPRIRPRMSPPTIRTSWSGTGTATRCSSRWTGAEHREPAESDDRLPRGLRRAGRRRANRRLERSEAGIRMTGSRLRQSWIRPPRAGPRARGCARAARAPRARSGAHARA